MIKEICDRCKDERIIESSDHPKGFIINGKGVELCDECEKILTMIERNLEVDRHIRLKSFMEVRNGITSK